MAKIQFSLEAFQEPKGFIKVLILCTSLVSFALLASCSEYPFSSVLFGSSVQTSAEFYVAMGVITFVFCLVDIALYATILHLFNNLYWKIEFFYNILWSFLWLIAASVWAAKRLDTGSISRSCSQKSDASLVRNIFSGSLFKL
eukprot:Sdes_comp19689_c0_seq4m11585